jgi:hypothetical protein
MAELSSGMGGKYSEKYFQSFLDSKIIDESLLLKTQSKILELTAIKQKSLKQWNFKAANVAR